MKNQKTAIIGAGVCGLYLAWKLAGKGADIVVFEKNEKIGKQGCSGLFSERILDFVPQSRELIQNEIKSALIHFPGKTVKLDFSRKFFVMEHAELDRVVASLAKKAGAEIVLGKTISALPKGFTKVIGADGAVSSVRRILKAGEPEFRLGLQGFVSKKDDSDFVETWPTDSGFLWKIPRGEEVEYGIMEKLDRAKPVFNDFLRERKIEPEKRVLAVIPQGFVVSPYPEIALCGDAAGLTKPWSGGGVVWGLKAADILLKNFPDFLKYRKELKRFFYPKIMLSKAAVKVVYFTGFKMPWLLPGNVKIESDFLL